MVETVLRVDRDGLARDDEFGRAIITGHADFGDRVAMFSCYVDMKKGVDGRYPVFAVVRLEKLRWSPAEMWAEDPLVEVLRSNRFKVHCLEVTRGRRLLITLLKLETFLEVPNYINRKEVIYLIRNEIVEKLWNVFKSLYEEEVEVDADEPETEKGWLDDEQEEEISREESEDDDPFESLEYWWRQYHRDDG